MSRLDLSLCTGAALAVLAASPALAIKGPQVPLSATSASRFDIALAGGGVSGWTVAHGLGLRGRPQRARVCVVRRRG